MTKNIEIIDAESVKVVYEEEAVNTNAPQEELIEDIMLTESMQAAIKLDRKLYKNRYQLNRDDTNLLPKVKTRKLDDKLYRPRTKNNSCLIKDFDKHKIRAFNFAESK
tara:strand:+ start:274 stop:597 length:324 start_codon:yes stop_codon:yes gene_type:complete